MRLNHPVEPGCVEYTSGPLENQILPWLGQDDLFAELKVN